MFFLLKSEKWAPYRDYCFKVHGTKTMAFVFGLVTVLMMPILFWIMRRGENAIQFWFGARTLAKFPSSDKAKMLARRYASAFLQVITQIICVCVPVPYIRNGSVYTDVYSQSRLITVAYNNVGRVRQSLT